MSMSVTFKPGSQQSYAASDYLSDLASDLVSAFIADMDARQYLVGDVSTGGLAVRIWSSWALDESEVLELLPWVRSLDRDLYLLEQGAAGSEGVSGIIGEWLSLRHGVSAFFVEVLLPDQAFSPEEQLRLSIGVIGGMTVMISAPSVMFVEQSPGLFGLSIAGQGSYLIETERVKQAVGVRRA